MKKIFLLAIVLILIICSTIWYFYFREVKVEKYDGKMEDITLKLKWLHQAQFAGNYVAVEKGFYENQGLKVNLSPYSYESSPIDSVIKGESEFGIAGADEILIARGNDMPVKAIAVIYKTNPVVAYSLKKDEITKPKDFVGKTVGIEKGTNVEYIYSAMMKKLKIDRTLIKEVAIGYDAKELLDGRVDIATGYIINEPNLAREAGQEVNTILMADYGINMYADVIFAKEDLIKTNPDLVGRFLSATLDGWQYAIENEKETVGIILKYATNSNVIHEESMLRDSIPLINDGKSKLGWMELGQWEQAHNILLSEKILSKPVNIKDAFDIQFLVDYYFNKKI